MSAAERTELDAVMEALRAANIPFTSEVTSPHHFQSVTVHHNTEAYVISSDGLESEDGDAWNIVEVYRDALWCAYVAGDIPAPAPQSTLIETANVAELVRAIQATTTNLIRLEREQQDHRGRVKRDTFTVAPDSRSGLFFCGQGAAVNVRIVHRDGATTTYSLPEDTALENQG